MSDRPPISSPVTAEAPPAIEPDPQVAAAPRRAEGAGALAAGVRVVSGLTLASRFAGLARDVITARLFGDTLLGSAFRSAYALPNFFRRLFGEGALSAAFLPEYAQRRRDDPETARAVAGIVLSLTTLVTCALTGLIELALLLRVALFPIEPDTLLSVRLVMLMLPMMPAVCLAAVLAGMLQAQRRFVIPSATPILLNLFQIAAGATFYFGWISDPTRAAFTVGAAALLASWASVVWALNALRGQIGWSRVRDAAPAARASARVILERFVPAMLGLGTLQLNTMLDMVIAMWPVWVGPTMFGRPTPLDDASNAILSYTQTVYQFPLGVFGIAVATAVFPLLASSARDKDAFAGHLRRGVRLSLFIGLPASLGLVLVRHDTVATIFGGGERSFSPEGLARSALVLGMFAPGVWAYSLNHVLTRAYYAVGNTKTPMRIAIASVVTNLSLNLVLIWSLREAGMALATTVSALLQTALLLALASRTLSVRPIDGETLRAVVRILVATALMGACVLAVQHAWPQTETWFGRAVRLAACVGAGGLGYLAAAKLLRLQELSWLLTRAPRGSGPSDIGFE